MPEAEALLKSGRVRSLTVMSPKRAANSRRANRRGGHGPKWHKGVWRAIVGPKGMPQDIATQYEKLLKKVYDSAEYQEFMAKRGFDVTWMGSAEFTQFLKKDGADIGAILKTLGLAK